MVVVGVTIVHRPSQQLCPLIGIDSRRVLALAHQFHRPVPIRLGNLGQIEACPAQPLAQQVGRVVALDGQHDELPWPLGRVGGDGELDGQLGVAGGRLFRAGEIPRVVVVAMDSPVGTERAERQASEGLIEAYVHPGSQIAVLLELNCETDFVARTDDFKTLAHDLALHIAFAAPLYHVREDVQDEVVEQERARFRAEALADGKPERIVDRIVEGRLEKLDKVIKVAVMGCVVNGPGEAKDADVGIACGKG